MLIRSSVSFLRSVEGPSTTLRQVSYFPSFKIVSLRRKLAEKLSNKYKEDRVKEIGPELACLEWLMECGSTEALMSDGSKISSIRQMKEYVQHIQKSPPELAGAPDDFAYEKKWVGIPRVYLLKANASDSAISNEGFKYFRELKRLEELKLNFCDYFGDEALRELAMSRPGSTLQNIEIVLNPSITDGAVYWLSRMKSLRRAHFYFLPYVSNRQAFLRQLKIALPRCKTTFPEAERIGYGYENEK